MEIKDHKAFKAWLKDQPREVCVAIAARAAMRVWPLVATASDSEFLDTASKEQAVLGSARALLTATCRLRVKNTAPAPDFPLLVEVNTAAEKAADASKALAKFKPACAASEAVSNSLGAIRAPGFVTFNSETLTFNGKPIVFTPSDASALGDAQINSDISLMRDELLQQPLWSAEELPGHLPTLKQITKSLSDLGSSFSFWARWFDAAYNGKPLDWELQERVALIPNDVWEAGPEAVAAEIALIEAEFATERLPQAEEIERDASDGLYDVVPVVLDPDEMIGKIFAQLRFSLDMALRGHNRSGYDDLCVSYAYLKHTFENCRDDPNAVHMHLRLAREIIEGKLASGEYAEEAGLTALLSAMSRHEIQLRADHPEVRRGHDAFVAQRLREADEATKLAIAESFHDLEADTKGRLRAEYNLDARVLESDSGAEAQADAIKRSGGRSQKMALDLRKSGEVVKAIDGSAANKAFGLAMRLQKLWDLIAPLL